MIIFYICGLGGITKLDINIIYRYIKITKRYEDQQQIWRSTKDMKINKRYEDQQKISRWKKMLGIIFKFKFEPDFKLSLLSTNLHAPNEEHTRNIPKSHALKSHPFNLRTLFLASCLTIVHSDPFFLRCIHFRICINNSRRTNCHIVDDVEVGKKSWNLYIRRLVVGSTFCSGLDH